MLSLGSTLPSRREERLQPARPPTNAAFPLRHLGGEASLRARTTGFARICGMTLRDPSFHQAPASRNGRSDSARISFTAKPACPVFCRTVFLDDAPSVWMSRLLPTRSRRSPVQPHKVNQGESSQLSNSPPLASGIAANRLQSLALPVWSFG
jgi:hypothetical protein